MIRTKRDRVRKIKWVNDNIDNIGRNDRAVIFNHMVQYIGLDVFYEEGTGIRIAYKNIPNYVLDIIKNEMKVYREKYTFEKNGRI